MAYRFTTTNTNCNLQIQLPLPIYYGAYGVFKLAGLKTVSRFYSNLMISPEACNSAGAIFALRMFSIAAPERLGKRGTFENNTFSL
jgi:hypothetical protein